jgi:MSHA biogenesis protein MshO
MRRQGGFTMVEFVVVIVVTAFLAVTVAVVVKPTVDSYVGVRTRAELIDQADLALRRMVRDVRMGVPNSIRMPGGQQCFEVVPFVTSGRYRKGPDTVNDSPAGCSVPTSTCSAPLDTTTITSVFDVFNPLSPMAAVGDDVVVNNQNGNDIYEGANRSTILNIATPTATQGRYRFTIVPKQFPYGYEGGRFQVIPGSQKAVFYVCSGADGVDANGDGKGKLYRLKNYGFNSSYPSACPSVLGADVLASRVKSCTFTYDPNKGATQQSGYLAIMIEISRGGESTVLSAGAHISNVP